MCEAWRRRREFTCSCAGRGATRFVRRPMIGCGWNHITRVHARVSCASGTRSGSLYMRCNATIGWSALCPTDPSRHSSPQTAKADQISVTFTVHQGFSTHRTIPYCEKMLGRISVLSRLSSETVHRRDLASRGSNKRDTPPTPSPLLELKISGAARAPLRTLRRHSPSQCPAPECEVPQRHGHVASTSCRPHGTPMLLSHSPSDPLPALVTVA